MFDHIFSIKRKETMNTFLKKATNYFQPNYSVPWGLNPLPPSKTPSLFLANPFPLNQKTVQAAPLFRQSSPSILAFREPPPT